MIKYRSVYHYYLILSVWCILISSGCANTINNSLTDDIPEIRPGILQGYLPKSELPNALKMLPPMPAKDSESFTYDKLISEQSLALQGTPRWDLAIQDANIYFPEAAKVFSCALQVPISKQESPNLYRLLRRSLADAGLATYSAKNFYNRPRPFTDNNQPICTPEDRLKLRKDGSYPSGHSAVGWAWALILSELSPEHTEAIIRRGRAFAKSRVICNVHWQSDVNGGRDVGAVAVAKLHNNTLFLTDLNMAKKELITMRTKGLKPESDCELESEILNSFPLLHH